MKDPELTEEQQRALQDCSDTGKQSVVGTVNSWLWPDCEACAGWRGIAIGVAISAVTVVIFNRYF